MKRDEKIYSNTRLMAEWFVLIITTLTAVSCVKEDTVTSGMAPNEEKIIHLRVGLPASSGGKNTRSITNREENNISTLYILSFTIGNDNTELFDYWTQGTRLDGNDNGSSVQDFSATVKVREHPQRFVLLANIGKDSKELLAQGNWQGVIKDEMLSLFEESLSEGELKWNAESPLDYCPIPMWGESSPETISGYTVNLTQTIPLLRMVAKIDVQLDESVTGLTEKFKLRSVRLYNTNTKGRLVPDKNNIEDFTAGGLRTITPKAPSIPADVADYDHRHVGPVVYEDFSAPGQQDVAIRNAIYLFETASTTEHLEATCLVIGGIYGSDITETFYRVDFIENGNNHVRDILRNYQYTVNITGVNRIGQADPDEAFHSRGENIHASILVWDVADMDDLIFDDQYYYSVSPRNFEFQAGPSTGNAIKVLTDYPHWSYELSDKPNPGNPQAKPVNVDWISVKSHQADVNNPGQGIPAYLEYDIAVNDGTKARTAYIHITAGRVTMKVTIRQGYSLIESVTIEPTGIIPTTGQSRTVRATGVFESLEVRARDLQSGEILDQNIIHSGQHGNSALLYIPAYQSNILPLPSKTVGFEYYDPQMSDWIMIRTDIQQGIWFDISVDHPQDDNIPGIGRYYTVSIQGAYPQLYLRSATDDDKLWEGLSIIAGSAETLTEVGRIYVPVNGTEKSRTVYLQYSGDRVNWTTISSGIQTSDHFKLTTGRIVAQEDIATMNWTQAMSISGIYSTMAYYLSHSGDPDNFYYTPLPTIGTGCGIYAEAVDASDRGMWRLPTALEIEQMATNYTVIGGFPTGRRYWTSSEYDASSVHAVTVPGGAWSRFMKTTSLWVRCVLDVH